MDNFKHAHTHSSMLLSSVRTYFPMFRMSTCRFSRKTEMKYDKSVRRNVPNKAERRLAHI